HFQACADLGCPSDDLVQAFKRQHPQPTHSVTGVAQGDQRQEGITVLPASQLDCFCLDLYAIAHASLFAVGGTANLVAGVDGLDIVEIKPDGLENSLLCYMKLMLELGLLAGGFSYSHLTQTVTGLTVTVAPTPVSAMFAAVRNGFHPCFSLSKNLGPFTVRAAAGGHLENGTVTLANDGTITVKDLALKWDTLSLHLDVDIPEICVGGFCLIPTP